MKTFKCIECGKETPSRKGGSKYCLECGIKKNREETEYAKTKIRSEEARIELANIRLHRVEAERLAFLAELEGEHYASKEYSEDKATETEFEGRWYPVKMA